LIEVNMDWKKVARWTGIIIGTLLGAFVGYHLAGIVLILLHVM